MHHRRSHSDPVDAKDNDPSLDNDDVDDVDEVESVCSSTSSVRTVDLYRGWSLPSLDLNLRIPGWFVMLVTLFIFRG
jgi:hypothetical protein